MTIERYLKAAHLLQQRSTNRIGVMGKDSQFLFQFHIPNKEVLKQPSKVYSEISSIVKTAFPGADTQLAPELSDLKSFSIVEIKDTFRFWEILGFMSTQEPGTFHYMKHQSGSLGFQNYTWDGFNLKRTSSSPIENAYAKYQFKWDHPIVEINDVTDIALAELIT